jgi:hypothetical protein
MMPLILVTPAPLRKEDLIGKPTRAQERRKARSMARGVKDLAIPMGTGVTQRSRVGRQVTTWH